MRNRLKLFIIGVSCFLIAACTNVNEESAEPAINPPLEEQPDAPDLEDQDDVDEPTTDEQEAQDETHEANGEEPDDSSAETNEIVLENEAFKIFTPAPDASFDEDIEVHGLARVFEGTIQYEFEDGHFILDEGFVTASEGAPGWGEFTLTIPLDDALDGDHKIILYEESAKDGSRLHELIIPVDVNK